MNLPPEIYSPIATLTASLVTGVLSALLTANLAFRRFRKEKWWDEKYKAYICILDALYKVGVGFDHQIDARASGWELTEEKKEVFRILHHEGTTTIEKQIYVGSLTLDIRVKPRLRKLISDLEKAGNSTDFVAYASGCSDATWECIEDITEIANLELN